nr:integrase, catalytic region, zinc finger, CCHC-type, peptidase aspartic, catalytic [Tanacetum cinerariifolium]
MQGTKPQYKTAEWWFRMFRGQARPGEARPVKCYNCNGTGHIIRNCTQPKQPQNSKYYKDKMLLMQAQENGVDLDAEQLLFLTDEALTTQTMFMANLSSADPVTDEAGPSYDSNILSEVHNHDHYQDAACAHHEEHVMHDSHVLYNGHEIIKDNHAPAIVHNTEDTLEMTEITRKKMNAKMNEPECVTRQVKIAPHDYSKENFLATFTPQKQLTHEQIFWSHDLIKLKSKALKERTTVSRPIKALIIYPPNTPTTLVPKVLPTKRGNFLDKIPRECLSIIESKSKVRYSRSRVTDVRENANAPFSSSSPSYSFDLQQIAASLKDKLDIRMNRFEKSLNDIKNSFIPPTAPLKAVKE